MYCYVTYLDDIDEAHIAYSLDNILLVAKRDDIHCFSLYVCTLLHFRVRSNFTIHRWPLQFISWKSNGQNVENIYKKFVASYMLKVKDGVANPFIPNIYFHKRCADPRIKSYMQFSKGLHQILLRLTSVCAKSMNLSNLGSPQEWQSIFTRQYLAALIIN